MSNTGNFLGFTGKQLRINLNRKDVQIEPVSPELTRKFLGGAGYGAKVLYDELKPGIDPLSPENILVFATGPLSMSQFPGGGSMMACFKSPLTNIWAESRTGGDSAPDLKKAGFDHIIIEGRASEPVMIFINNQNIEIRNASHLLGMTVSEKSKAIREELGDKRISILCIGPAGEKLSRIAAIMSDDRAAGRCGGGAVMGSKNLIAIAIKGTGKVDVADPVKLKEVLRRALVDLRANPFYDGFKNFGTIGDMPGNDDGGDWPSKNWESNSWGKGPELFDYYQKNNFIKGYGCYHGCTIGCARWVQVADSEFKTPAHGGAEYESMSCFTAFVMNTDVDAAVNGTYLCNEYGIDTISAGAVIAFAMECAEKGLFTKDQLNGLDLHWGNGAILPVMVKMISLRQGIGDILAEGVRIAAQKIGQGSEEFAIHVKGLEGPAHDPRSGKALGVAYATGNRGMCHIHPLEGMAWDRGKVDWGLQKFGIPDPNEVERWDETGKGRAVKLLQDGVALSDIIGTCKFFAYAGMTPDHWAEMMQALTGWDIDGKELMQTGERVLNLQRMFNVREGITPKDDRLPKRVLTIPAFGKYCTEPDCVIHDFDALMAEYYEARGWDPITGAPKSEKLRELGLV